MCVRERVCVYIYENVASVLLSLNEHHNHKSKATQECDVVINANRNIKHDSNSNSIQISWREYW